MSFPTLPLRLKSAHIPLKGRQIRLPRAKRRSLPTVCFRNAVMFFEVFQVRALPLNGTSRKPYLVCPGVTFMNQDQPELRIQQHWGIKKQNFASRLLLILDKILIRALLHV